MARRVMRRRWGIVMVLTLGLALVGGTQRAPGRALAASAPSPLYDVVYLGTLGGDTQVNALNQAGEVAGYSDTPDGHMHAYWEYPLQDGGGQPGYASVPFDMGTLGGPDSQANALTNVNGGEVAGGADTDATNGVGLPSEHAFRSGASSVIVGAGPDTDDRSTLGGSFSDATGINDQLEMVGASDTAAGARHAFRTAPGQPINPATDDLGTFGGPSSEAEAINNAGEVVGEAATSAGPSHAFRTAPQADGTPGLIDLGTLGGDYSRARSINEAGQVVGDSDTSDDDQHAFRTGANRPIDAATDDLGTLGGSYSHARGINNAGQVVGAAVTSAGVYHAFLYSDGVGMRDLNDLIPAGTGWVLTEAVAINDAGQIAVDGTFNGQTRACLLTPRPAAPTATDTATATSAPPTATASPSATATRAASATATSTPPATAVSTSATPSATPARTHTGPPFGPAGPAHGPAIPTGAPKVTSSATPSATPSATVVPAGSASTPTGHPTPPTSSSAHRAPCRAAVPPLHLVALYVRGRTLTLRVTARPHARVALALRVLSTRTLPAPGTHGTHGTARRVARTLYRLTTAVTTDGRGTARARLTLRTVGHQSLAGELTASVRAGCRTATATAHLVLSPKAH